tara:strand:+ start:465 stop:662 length:198 start_codon:yes stop_codon:yes gene_type:complete
MKNLEAMLAIGIMSDYTNHAIAWWPELEEGICAALDTMIMNIECGSTRNEAMDKCLADIKTLIEN